MASDMSTYERLMWTVFGAVVIKVAILLVVSIL